MKINQSTVWVLQIANVFMQEYNYIPVRTNDPETNEEVWLVNQDAEKYPIVRITPFNANADKYDLERILVVYQAIINRTSNTGKLLSIHLSNEDPKEIDQNIEEFCFDLDYQSSDLLDREFPKLTGILKPIEDPALEYQKTIQSLQRVNATQRVNQRPKGKKKVKSYEIVALICLIITVANAMLISRFKSDVLVAILTGALYKTLIYGNHEYWRLLTAGFVHTSWLHLLCNLYAFMNTARFVERFYGKKKMIAGLLISVLTSSLFVIAAESNGVTLGLSGGIFGLFGMLVVYLFESGAIKNRQILRTVSTTIMINAIISFMPNISLIGHLGGIVGGVFCGLIFSTKPDWKQLRLHSMIASCVILVCIGYTMINDKKKTPLYGGTDIQYIETLKELGLNSYAEYTEKNLTEYYMKVGL